MSHLVVMIGRLEDEHQAEVMTEVWRQRLPDIGLEGLEAQRYLDELESGVGEEGVAVIRQLLVEQGCLTEQAVVAR